MRAIHIRTFQRLTIIGAILAAALLLGSPAPSDAAVIVLVSNTGQSGFGGTPVGADDHAQGFTTGNNTLGYVLTSIELQVHTAPASGTLTVSVRGADGQDPSDTVLYTLTNPNNLGTGLRTFTAPANSSLSAETTYFVHMTFAVGLNPTQPQWNLTDRTQEDSGAYAGWSIANDRHVRATGSTGNWGTPNNARIKIKVKGEILTMAAPANLTAAVGDGQVTLSWNDPNNSSITGYRVLWMEPMVKLVDPSHSSNSSVAIQSGDRFGQSVGIDGDRAVVGAPLQESLNNSNDSITDGGWAHAYSSGSSGWSYDEFLAVSDPQENGRLGESVAIASRTAVVGAPSYYEVTDPGKVIIAAKGGISNSWAIKFTETGDEDNDYLGTSVAIDDGIAVAGARGIEINNLGDAGKAFVYTRDSDNQDSGVWSEEAALDPGANVGIGNLGNRFGSSVAVHDGTIVVGAWGEDFTRGAAYVFTKNSQGDWTRVDRLTASSREVGDAFGSAVAIDGNTIVVGADNWDGGAEGSPQHGAAFVFTKNNNVWTQVARLTASDADDDDAFGFAVAVDGDTIVVGAPVDEDDDDDDSGSVYLFTKPSGGWATANETVQLTASDAAAGDNVGYSVAAGGGRFIVGAPGFASDKGAAYVYSIPEWTDIPVPASNSGTMSYTVTGLDNDVEYTFWVRPVDSGGPGPVSDSVTATPEDAAAATPANLTARGIDREVTLSWVDPNDSSIERYRYRQKEGDGTFGSWNDIEHANIDSTSEPGKLKYTVSDLTNGITYTFQIYAKDNHEDSASAEVSASPAPPPPLPLVPVFVSNIGQDTDTSVGVDADLSSDQAQGFSTGGNTDDYLLGSIDLYFQSGTDKEDLTVSVWNEELGFPKALEYTLTNPDTIESGLVRFTVDVDADADAELDANAHY